MTKTWTAALALLLSAACSNPRSASDAFGNFEADEVIVSAEIAGRLTLFTPKEGDRLDAGALVASVDTVQLSLRAEQVWASRRAIQSRFPGIAAQADVLETQIRVAARELERLEGLLADGAATGKQLDDVRGQIDVLRQQLQAVRAQNAPVFAELDVADAQLNIIRDQIRRSRVLNPVRGTVLVTYAEQSEITAPGKPLYRIAKLDTLELRAYISGAQLPHVRLGQEVDVLIDADAESNRSLRGVVSHIASEAEFTPKLIQTKEERVALVYAFLIRVPNPDGAVKIGMPGEVVLD